MSEPTPDYRLWKPRTGDEPPIPVVEMTEEIRQKMREAIANLPPRPDFDQLIKEFDDPATRKMYVD